MALKVKLSQFGTISTSSLNDTDKMPVLQFDNAANDFVNKNITLGILKDELFRENGIQIIGDSFITGNLYITGSLVAERIVSSSTVELGDNTILLNTNAPAKRYAGIEVIDSGSSPNPSSSFLWDSLQNHWILTELSASKINIGVPNDNSYGDGFFDEFTSKTNLADALDEISEAFLDLAPPKAGTLTGMSLSASNMSFFSGKLAGGLNSEWYSGSSVAGSDVTTIISAPRVQLHSPFYNVSPSSSHFRSGKFSDFSNLKGGVTASGVKGNLLINLNAGSTVPLRNSTASIVSSSNSIGNGVPPTLFINGTKRYNTFWTQTSASLSASLIDTGSYSFVMAADNGANTSSLFTVWYTSNDSTNNFPNQSLTSISASITSNPTLKYLSGIPYLSGSIVCNTFITASNLHNPVYLTNPLTISSGNPSNWRASTSTGSATIPNYNDTIRVLVSTTANTTSNVTSSYNTIPTIIVTASKPGKSSVTSTITGSIYPINNYGNPASISTNAASSVTEHFLDEYYRVTHLTASINQFPSSSNLTASILTNPPQLQVQNGRLIAGGAPNGSGSYSNFTSGSSGTGYANYFRRISGSNSSGGSITMSVVGSLFDKINKWGSDTTGLQVSLIKSSSVLLTSQTASSEIYDLGRTFNDNSIVEGQQVFGSFIGTAPTVNSGKIICSWTLGTATTNFNVILWIRFKTANNNYIDDFTITFN